MRRALAAIALLAFLPSANAQDKAKGDFTHGGEFRLRDNWMTNATGNKGSNNAVTERFRLDLGFKPAEKLMANVTLLNNIQLGRAAATNTPDGTSPNANTPVEDFFTVNQAYATWITSDDFNLKAGRMNYQIGDGSLVAVNDWEPVPYAFEGLLGNYEAEFGRLQGFLFKYADKTGGTASDPEQNAYGLNFDLKTMPEVLKGVNVHLIKDSADATGVGSTIKGNQGKDILRYGLNATFNFTMVDLKAWYEAYSGKHKFVSAESRDTSGNMMQAEVGANLANFMGSRAFLRYHQDSGDSDVGGATDTKDEAYDPYFHEKHGAAGQMDLFDWGNLTFIELGWSGKPMDSTEVGLNYWMFSRTKKSSAGGPNSSPVNKGTNNKFDSTGDLTKDKLGDEIDIWASHKYDNGLTTIVRLGYFMPGNFYTSDTLADPPTGAAGDKLKEKPMQVFVEARFPF